jgi:hypothetical protein
MDVVNQGGCIGNALEDHPFIARLRPDILPLISDILSGFQPEVFIEHA